jgi:hypothetical protein
MNYADIILDDNDDDYCYLYDLSNSICLKDIKAIIFHHHFYDFLENIEKLNLFIIQLSYLPTYLVFGFHVKIEEKFVNIFLNIFQ